MAKRRANPKALNPSPDLYLTGFIIKGYLVKVAFFI